MESVFYQRDGCDIVVKKGVFVKYRFGLSLNGFLDWIKIYQFLKDRTFDDSEQSSVMFQMDSVSFHCKRLIKGAHEEPA